MSKLPAIQFYPADWRKDPGIQALSYEDRGVWFEIILLMHESPRRGVLLLPNGVPMTSTTLARILGIATPKMVKILDRISAVGVSDREDGTGALTNRRMLRDEEIRYKRAVGGKDGAEHGIKGKPFGIGGGRPLTENPPSNPPPCPPSTPPLPLHLHSSSSSSGDSTVHNSPFEVSPPPNGRARDLAADWFADRCLELTGSPYVSEAGDFVQLARLRKGFKLPSREKPPGWDDAVTNYFASPLSQYSLADLANPKRYAVFKNSPLNEFKVPVNHQKAQGETHEQRKERVRQENLQSVLSRIAESGESGLKPGTERGANGDLHRIAGKSQ